MGLYSRTVDEGRHQITTNIIQTVAEAENVAPHELTPPLNDSLDADALELLIQSADERARVTFDYRDWLVEVRGDSTVEVTSLPEDG